MYSLDEKLLISLYANTAIGTLGGLTVLTNVSSNTSLFVDELRKFSPDERLRLHTQSVRQYVMLVASWLTKVELQLA